MENGNTNNAENSPVKQIFLKYRIHLVLFWIVLFAAFVIRQSGEQIRLVTIVYNLSFIVVTAVFSSIVMFYLLPKFAYPKKLAVFFLLFLVLLVVFSIINAYVSFNVLLYLGEHPVRSGFERRIQGEMIFTFLATLSFGAIKITTDFLLAKWEEEKERKELLKQELEFLKSQLHPHFLFNTLNNVYFLIKENPALASDKLLRLSDIMRYQLYESDTELIFLKKEIENIRNYTELEKIRKESNLRIEIKIDDGVSEQKIAPYLLLPVVENAFKHLSDFENKENIVLIKLIVLESGIKFIVANTKDDVPGMNGYKSDQAGGIGYKNLKRRLDLLYPGRYSMDINEDESNYEVTLTLQTESTE